ncbi:hypothetical protein NIES2100_59290 [Calothrix sp. NIES-2100]|uniref:hypothetical protein n=1 Tax=Calothrix sp. NIES-2100 TaxID=1954172 RepID=UPI000B610432|nr:hypothetical protein NIES2100_59290 [Calothrix sp. NIES-2100]
MPEEIKPNVNEAPTHDAQLAAENIAAGEEKAPTVDFEADYAAAQQFSVSEIDRTGEGAKAAEAATAPKQQVSQPQEVRTQAEATGNPDDYADMAKDVAGSRTEGATQVDDDLVQKALEKGQRKN